MNKKCTQNHSEKNNIKQIHSIATKHVKITTQSEIALKNILLLYMTHPNIAKPINKKLKSINLYLEIIPDHETPIKKRPI